MKRNITEKAILACVSLYGDAKRGEDKATEHAVREYFFGKRIGIIEAFAELTGQPWINAETMLRQRHNAMLKEAGK